MMPRPLVLLLVLAAVAAPAATPVRADVRPHPLFGPGAVLQRGARVPIYGTADEGEEVTVRFQGREAKARASQGGAWSVALENLEAGGPFPLVIAGKNTVNVPDVLVGEVWVCSGQSNMAFPVSRSGCGPAAIAGSADPLLRLLQVPRKPSPTPQAELVASWKAAGPETVGTFSAVGYAFGRDLRKALKVPVGLIDSSVGGTPAEAWTSRPALEADPDLRGVLAADAQRIEAYPEALKKFDRTKAAHAEAAARARRDKVKVPTAPRPPAGPDSPQRPAVLFNGMIAPLQPYAIRGAIWYQGESNSGRAYQYEHLMTTMIRTWREAWGLGEFPFLVVQLAPFHEIKPEPSESTWAELREAQRRLTRSVPKVGLAVITDVGDPKDIHPTAKFPVGARLALLARSIAYGEAIVGSGPEYESMSVAGDRATIRFRSVGGGLVAEGGTLKGFTVAGEDRRFVPAEAEIQGETVVVHAPGVAKPFAVRYGWADYPVVNLRNAEGLLASPFRTDDFPMTTRPALPKAAARVREGAPGGPG